MRHLTKGSKTINVRLNEEKFYFPGDTISGIVIVHPKSPTKTNQIRLRFSGQVHLALKDKETIPLFQETKTIPVSNDGNSKSHILEAKQHTFAFEFMVPKDLPSSMEFEKRKARIRYTLTAIHDRPRVPESLCAKAEYTVPILEYVDVTSAKYRKPQEYTLDFTVPKSKKPQKSHLKASIPRLGYTRGEFVPLSMVLNHHEALVRKTGVKVELVRAVDIRTARNNLSKEDILKSFEHDVNIIGPYNFSQTLTSQLPLPTSTPPSIRYKDKIIDIRYKIRIRLFMNEGKNSTETHHLEIPFIIGTWPRAAVPIDDEDDNELLETMGELMLSDEEDDDDLGFDDRSVSYDGEHGPQPTRTSSASVTHRRNLSNPLNNLKSASSSAATLTLRNSQIYSANSGVVRSDSNASRSSLRSHGSARSYHSNHSWDQSPMLSRNTSIGTSVTTPEQQQYMANHSMALSAIGQNFLNRSTSTPDLLNQVTPDGMHYQNGYRVPDPRMVQYQTNRGSFHENKMMDYYQQHAASRPYYGLDHQQQQQQQQQYPQQLAAPPSYPAYTPLSYGNAFRYPSEYQQPPAASTQNVPTHVLQPLDSTPYQPRRSESTSPTLSSPPLQKAPNPFHSNHNISRSTVQDLSDSDDSDDDGDLFRIIEKKKKERQKQQWMHQHQ